MRALTLKDYKEEKYATWVMQGIKDIETRKWMPEDWQEGNEWDLLITCSKSSSSQYAGKAISVVTLFHIEEMKEDHEERACCKLYFRRGGKPAYSWFLKDRRLLSRNFDVTGTLGIWNCEVPKDITFIKQPSLYVDQLTIQERKGFLF